MFDSLKEKLGSFRDDVEEQAEIEEVDEDEVTDEEVADEETVAEADESSGQTDADAVEGDEQATQVGEETDEGREDESDEDEEESGESDNNGSAGFTQKAKSFARGRFVIEEEDLEDPLWELEMALLESDVEMSVAEEISEGIREELVGETRKFT